MAKIATFTYLAFFLHSFNFWYIFEDDLKNEKHSKYNDVGKKP